MDPIIIQKHTHRRTNMGRNAQKSTKTTKGVDTIDDTAIYTPLAHTHNIYKTQTQPFISNNPLVQKHVSSSKINIKHLFLTHINRWALIRIVTRLTETITLKLCVYVPQYTSMIK